MVFSKKILTIALIVLVLGAAGYYFLVVKTGAEGETAAAQDGEEEQSETSEAPLPVKVAEVRRGDLVIKLRSPGEAISNRHVEMKAELAGTVERVLVRESQRVEKGQVLLELDDREHRLNLENAEANRLKALSEFILEQQFGAVDLSPEDAAAQGNTFMQDLEKLGDLFKKGMISQEEYESRRKQLEIAMIKSGAKKDDIMEASKGLTQADIAVRQAQLNLEKTQVRAPFSGIITDIRISPGQTVSGGTDLFTLVNIDRLQVHAKVLESEIGKMKVGREVDLKFSAYPGEVFKGQVQAISPIVDPEDKTCNVIVDLVNVGEAIKPGMHAEVEIAAEIYPDRLLVPQDAILTRNQRKLVFVVEGDRAKWKYIEVGMENEDFAEVLPTDDPGGAVKAGDLVLVDGHFTIAHDARIQVVE